MELMKREFVRALAPALVLPLLLACNVAHATSPYRPCDTSLEGTILIVTTDRSEEHALRGEEDIEVPHDVAGAACVTLSTSGCYGSEVVVRNGCEVAVRWSCGEVELSEIPVDDEVEIELGLGDISRSCTLEVLDTEIQVEIDGESSEIPAGPIEGDSPPSSESSEDNDGCSVTSLHTPSKSLPLALLLLGGCLIARRRRRMDSVC